MVIFMILGSLVVVAIGVVGFLFYLLQKEAEEDKVGNNFSEIKKAFIVPSPVRVEQPIEVLPRNHADV